MRGAPDPEPLSPLRPIDDLIASVNAADLLAAAGDRRLTVDLAMALLEKRDLPPRALELLSRNIGILKHRKVLNALVTHPRTPRYVTLPVLRRMFTFELMKIALTPAVATVVKMTADEVIIARLEAISPGERMALARQGSRHLVSALLLDPEQRIGAVALDNPRLTEADVVKALMNDDIPQHFIVAVCGHAKWRLRNEVQVAILKHPQSPLARVIEIAGYAPPSVVKQVLNTSRLADNVKNYLAAKLERQAKRESR